MVSGFCGHDEWSLCQWSVVAVFRPRTMPIPGQDLDNVCVLRTPKDANRIAANSQGKKVVIIGSSFIGQ